MGVILSEANHCSIVICEVEGSAVVFFNSFSRPDRCLFKAIGPFTFTAGVRKQASEQYRKLGVCRGVGILWLLHFVAA
jgi:hypothetical protein